MAIKPIKVSQLNGYIKRILQTDPLLGNVSVVGEISNLKLHGTGHVYFTLKDDHSKINCFLASENRKNIRYELADGMEIIANGYIYLFERGGSYSLNIRDITVEGIGSLTVAFERLKEKLAKEGLFEEKYKKTIPFFPQKVVVITSDTGAAVRDIIKIIKSRNNIVDVLVYPCQVQGIGAAEDIAASIKNVNRLFPETDTLIIGRGGGSLEELWAFNEEIVARSIFASKIPVISAVGHETDFTISDFVADKRAETPTAAAQIAVPDIASLREYVNQEKDIMIRSMNQLTRYKDLQVLRCNIEALGISFQNRINMHLHKAGTQYQELQHQMDRKITEYDGKLNHMKAGLDALNPKNIMSRGYAAVLNADGRLSGSVEGFQIGDRLTAVLTDGSIACRIEDIRRDRNEGGKTENQF